MSGRLNGLNYEPKRTFNRLYYTINLLTISEDSIRVCLLNVQYIVFIFSIFFQEVPGNVR